MTPQEIDRIECAIRHIQTSTDIDPWAMEIAVEAMRKQIPLMPMKSLDVDTKSLYRLYCPTCGVKIGHGNSRVGYIVKTYGSEKYCGNCGQAIDWEEVRDDEHIADVSKKVERASETAQNVRDGDKRKINDDKV